MNPGLQAPGRFCRPILPCCSHQRCIETRLLVPCSGNQYIQDLMFKVIGVSNFLYLKSSTYFSLFVGIIIIVCSIYSLPLLATNSLDSPFPSNVLLFSPRFKADVVMWLHFMLALSCGLEALCFWLVLIDSLYGLLFYHG